MGFNLTEITNKSVPINGQVDAKITRGEYVKIPFRSGYYYADNVSSTATYQSQGIYDNEDGSDTGINISVPQGLNYGVRIRFPFYGTVLGVRFRHGSSYNNFGVSIDGVAYGPISAQHTYLDNEAASLTDGESLVMIDTDLPDGLHYADIVLTSQSSATSSMFLFGIVVEKRAGYENKPRQQYIIGTTAITTSQTAISLGSPAASQARGVRQIIYTNTSASSITVTVQNNSTTIWQKAIAAGDTAILDFGASTALTVSITHAASATGINATLIGGY
jgi:hypothetical protein